MTELGENRLSRHLQSVDRIRPWATTATALSSRVATSLRIGSRCLSMNLSARRRIDSFVSIPSPSRCISEPSLTTVLILLEGVRGFEENAFPSKGPKSCSRSSGSGNGDGVASPSLWSNLNWARYILSAVSRARLRSEEKICVNRMPWPAKNLPRRYAWKTPWLVKGESVTPALSWRNEDQLPDLAPEEEELTRRLSHYLPFRRDG